MGIFNKIFGSDDERATLVNGTVAGLDKLVFTSEEKNDANYKAAELILKYMEATTPQNVARRLLAMIVALLWSFLVLLGVVAWQWNIEFSEFVFKTISELVMQPFSIIIGFYFLTHTVRAYTDGIQKGKG